MVRAAKSVYVLFVVVPMCIAVRGLHPSRRAWSHYSFASIHYRLCVCESVIIIAMRWWQHGSVDCVGMCSTYWATCMNLSFVSFGCISSDLRTQHTHTTPCRVRNVSCRVVYYTFPQYSSLEFTVPECVMKSI